MQVVYYHVFFIISEEILFRKAKSRLDWLNHSVALWSGLAGSRGHCCSLCAKESKCLSVVYVSTEKTCKLYDMQHEVDESAPESDTEYYRAANRRCKCCRILSKLISAKTLNINLLKTTTVDATAVLSLYSLFI